MATGKAGSSTSTDKPTPFWEDEAFKAKYGGTRIANTAQFPNRYDGNQAPAAINAPNQAAPQLSYDQKAIDQFNQIDPSVRARMQRDYAQAASNQIDPGIVNYVNNKIGNNQPAATAGQTPSALTTGPADAGVAAYLKAHQGSPDPLANFRPGAAPTPNPFQLTPSTNLPSLSQPVNALPPAPGNHAQGRRDLIAPGSQGPIHQASTTPPTPFEQAAALVASGQSPTPGTYLFNQPNGSTQRLGMDNPSGFGQRFGDFVSQGFNIPEAFLGAMARRDSLVNRWLSILPLGGSLLKSVITQGMQYDRSGWIAQQTKLAAQGALTTDQLRHLNEVQMAIATQHQDVTDNWRRTAELWQNLWSSDPGPEVQQTFNPWNRTPAQETQLHQDVAAAKQEAGDLRTRAYQLLQDPFNGTNLQDATTLIRRAQQDDIETATFMDPTWSYSLSVDPHKEDLFREALVQAEMQKGSPLADYEIRSIKNYFIDPWEELPGQMFADLTQFLPIEQVVHGVTSLAGRAFAGLGDKGVEFGAKLIAENTSAAAEGSINAQRAIVRGQRIQAFSTPIAERTVTTLAKSAIGDLVERLPVIGNMISWLGKETRAAVGERLFSDTNEVLTKIANSSDNTEGFQTLLEKSANAGYASVASPAPFDMWNQVPASIGKRERDTLASLVTIIPPENWGTVVDDAAEKVSARAYAQEYTRLVLGGMDEAEAAAKAGAFAEEFVANPKNLVRDVAQTVRNVYVDAHTVAPRLLDDNLMVLAAKKLDLWDPPAEGAFESVAARQARQNVRNGIIAMDNITGMLSRWWVDMTLRARPGWVFTNMVDSTFRYLISGGRLFDDLGLITATDFEKAKSIEFAIPQDLMEAFARRDVPVGETVPVKLLNGWKPEWGPLSYIANRWSELRPAAAEELGLNPLKLWVQKTANFFDLIKDMGASDWPKVPLEGIKGGGGLVRDAFAAWTGGWTDFNAAMEFTLRLRLFHEHFTTAYATMEKRAIEEVLTEAAGKPWLQDMLQAMWVEAGANPDRLNAMILEQLGAPVAGRPLSWSMLVPTNIDTLAIGMSNSDRQLFVRQVLDHLRQVQAAAGEDFGPSHIAAAMDELRASFQDMLVEKGVRVEDVVQPRPEAEAAQMEDKRLDWAMRAEIDKLTPDEMKTAMLILRDQGSVNAGHAHELTGLRTKAAWALAVANGSFDGQTLVHADVAGLGWVNDNLGHGAGDELLKAFAQVTKDLGLKDSAYHISGDEFNLVFKTEAEARQTMDAIAQRFQDARITFTDTNGVEHAYTGSFLSYGSGTGRTAAEADTAAERGLIDAKRAAVADGFRPAVKGTKPSGLVEVASEPRGGPTERQVADQVGTLPPAQEIARPVDPSKATFNLRPQPFQTRPNLIENFKAAATRLGTVEEVSDLEVPLRVTFDGDQSVIQVNSRLLSDLKRGDIRTGIFNALESVLLHGDEAAVVDAFGSKVKWQVALRDFIDNPRLASQANLDHFQFIAAQLDRNPETRSLIEGLLGRPINYDEFVLRGSSDMSYLPADYQAMKAEWDAGLQHPPSPIYQQAGQAQARVKAAADTAVNEAVKAGTVTGDVQAKFAQSQRALDRMQSYLFDFFRGALPGPRRGGVGPQDLAKAWDEYFQYAARNYDMAAGLTRDAQAAALRGEPAATLSAQEFLNKSGIELRYDAKGNISSFKWTNLEGRELYRTSSQMRRALTATFLRDVKNSSASAMELFQRPFSEVIGEMALDASRPAAQASGEAAAARASVAAAVAERPTAAAIPTALKDISATPSGVRLRQDFWGWAQGAFRLDDRGMEAAQKLVDGIASVWKGRYSTDWYETFISRFQTVAKVSEIPSANVLTPEASALLAAIDAGGVPTQMTNNLVKIGRDNGINVVISLNSEGVPAANMTVDDLVQALRQQSAAYQTGSGFSTWFHGSKVLTDQGTPLVVYHGTTQPIEAFDFGKLGTNTSHPTNQLGTWFSESPDSAAQFAYGWNQDQWPWQRGPLEGANLVPAHLSLQNPYEISASEFVDQYVRPRNAQAIAQFKSDLLSQGYDGIHVVGDRGLSEVLGGDEWARDNWVAFEPTQVKSIFNTGAYDPADPRLLYHNQPLMQSAADWAHGKWIEPLGFQASPQDLYDAVMARMSGAGYDSISPEMKYAADQAARRYLEQWASSLLPEAGPGIQSQVRDGYTLVYRTARSAEEGTSILTAIEEGRDLGSGFRNSVTHVREATRRAVAKAERAGQTAVFVSNYPSVAGFYRDWNADLPITFAMEVPNDALLYTSNRAAGFTKGFAYSATYPDTEILIDANRINRMWQVPSETMTRIGDWAQELADSQVRKTGFANAFTDADPELAKVGAEALMDLREPPKSLGRPFLEAPMSLKEGMTLTKGDRVLLSTGDLVKVKNVEAVPAGYEAFNDGAKWRLSTDKLKNVPDGLYMNELNVYDHDVVRIVKKGERLPKATLDQAVRDARPQLLKKVLSRRDQLQQYAMEASALGQTDRVTGLIDNVNKLDAWLADNGVGATGGGLLFNEQPDTNWFYLQSQKLIEQKLGGRATGDEVLKLVRGKFMPEKVTQVEVDQLVWDPNSSILSGFQGDKRVFNRQVGRSQLADFVGPDVADQLAELGKMQAGVSQAPQLTAPGAEAVRLGNLQPDGLTYPVMRGNLTTDYLVRIYGVPAENQTYYALLNREGTVVENRFATEYDAMREAQRRLAAAGLFGPPAAPETALQPARTSFTLTTKEPAHWQGPISAQELKWTGLEDYLSMKPDERLPIERSQWPRLHPGEKWPGDDKWLETHKGGKSYTKDEILLYLDDHRPAMHLQVLPDAGGPPLVYEVSQQAAVGDGTNAIASYRIMSGDKTVGKLEWDALNSRWNILDVRGEQVDWESSLTRAKASAQTQFSGNPIGLKYNTNNYLVGLRNGEGDAPNPKEFLLTWQPPQVNQDFTLTPVGNDIWNVEGVQGNYQIRGLPTASGEPSGKFGLVRFTDANPNFPRNVPNTSTYDSLEEAKAGLQEYLNGNAFDYSSQKQFHSSGVETKNPIVVHVRSTDRVDEAGHKVFFIEEVQSDWHQDGRELGYQMDPAELNAILAPLQLEAENAGRAYSQAQARLLAANDTYDAAAAPWKAAHPDHYSLGYTDGFGGWHEVMQSPIGTEAERDAGANQVLQLRQELRNPQLHPELANEYVTFQRIENTDPLPDELVQLRAVVDQAQAENAAANDAMDAAYQAVKDQRQQFEKPGAVPPGPFGDDKYNELALNRMIRYASENGYDAIGWTTGATQTERWSYAERGVADDLRWNASTEQLIGYKNGQRTFTETVPRTQLAEYVGNDVANNMFRQVEGGVAEARVTGQDIAVGGQGFVDSYDRKLVKLGNKIGGKFGVQVEPGVFSVELPSEFAGEESYYEVYAPNGDDVAELQNTLDKAQEAYDRVDDALNVSKDGLATDYIWSSGATGTASNYGLHGTPIGVEQITDTPLANIKVDLQHRLWQAANEVRPGEAGDMAGNIMAGYLQTGTQGKWDFGDNFHNSMANQLQELAAADPGLPQAMDQFLQEQEYAWGQHINKMDELRAELEHLSTELDDAKAAFNNLGDLELEQVGDTFETEREAQRYIDRNNLQGAEIREGTSDGYYGGGETQDITFHKMVLNDEMKASALDGRPLFNKQRFSATAAVSFDRDQKAIIYAVQNKANMVSLVHEIAHVMEKQLDATDRAVVSAWAGKDMAAWGTPEREKFAKAFEKYLTGGQAPTPELEGPFAYLKNWILNVYRSITNYFSDVTVTPELKKVFDGLLTADPQVVADTATQARLSLPSRLIQKLNAPDADPLLQQAYQSELWRLMREVSDITTESNVGLRDGLSQAYPWWEKILAGTHPSDEAKAGMVLGQSNLPARLFDNPESLSARHYLTQLISDMMDGKKPDEAIGQMLAKRIQQTVAENLTMDGARPANPYVLQALGAAEEDINFAKAAWAQELGINDVQAMLQGLVNSQAHAEMSAAWDAFRNQARYPDGRTLAQAWGAPADTYESFRAYLRDYGARLQGQYGDKAKDLLSALDLIDREVQSFRSQSSQALHSLLPDSFWQMEEDLGKLTPTAIPSWSMPDDMRTWFLRADDLLAQVQAATQGLDQWQQYLLSNNRLAALSVKLSAEDKALLEQVGAHAVQNKYDLLNTVLHGGSVAGQDYGGVIPLVNKNMLTYTDATHFDDIMRIIMPFWMFPRRSLPFWAEYMALHPWLPSLYYKVIRASQSYAFQAGATTSSGQQLPSLEGYFPIPGTSIWFNPMKQLSFRYLLPTPAGRYTDTGEPASIAQQVYGWLHDYGQFLGFSFAPWLTLAAELGGVQNLDQTQAFSVIPELGLIPPWVERDLYEKVTRAGFPNVPNFWKTYIDPQPSFEDYLIERQLLTDANTRLQDPTLTTAQKYATVQAARDALTQREQNDLWTQTRDQVEKSNYYNQMVGFFTGFFGKDWTDANANFNDLRDQVNNLRDTINSEVGAALLQLDPDAEQRYQHYLDRRYQTPEGSLSTLYGTIRFTQTSTGDPVYGQERRDMITQGIHEDQVTQSYLDALGALKTQLDAKLKVLPVGADGQLTSQVWDWYFAQRLAIESSPMYADARRSWVMGYKPDTMLAEHYTDLWYQLLRESKPQWDQAGGQTYDDWQAQLSAWQASIPMRASELFTEFSKQAMQDAQATTDYPKIEAALKDLQANANYASYRKWEMSNDTPMDALNAAWKALYWDPYWAAISNKTGYVRDLAEQQFLADHPQPPSTLEMIGWIQGNYQPGQFDVKDLTAAASIQPPETIAARTAPKTEAASLVNEAYDLLGMAGPGAGHNKMVDAYVALGGSQSDFDIFYATNGAWRDPSLLQAFVDRLRLVAQGLKLTNPTPAMLAEWIHAQSLNDDYRARTEAKLGADIWTVISDYLSGNTAERKAARAADPRIDAYYSFRDQYAALYPEWAKYYDVTALTAAAKTAAASGGSGKSSSKKSSGGGGGGGSSSKTPAPLVDWLPLGQRSTLNATDLLGTALGKAGVPSKAPFWPAALWAKYGPPPKGFAAAAGQTLINELNTGSVSDAGALFLKRLGKSAPGYQAYVDKIVQGIADTASGKNQEIDPGILNYLRNK